MPRQTKDLFGNATQIAEKHIRHARAEQSDHLRDMVRAAAKTLFGKDRTNVEPMRVPATRKV